MRMEWGQLVVKLSQGEQHVWCLAQISEPSCTYMCVPVFLCSFVLMFSLLNCFQRIHYFHCKIGSNFITKCGKFQDFLRPPATLRGGLPVFGASRKSTSKMRGWPWTKVCQHKQGTGSWWFGLGSSVQWWDNARPKSGESFWMHRFLQPWMMQKDPLTSKTVLNKASWELPREH